MRNPYSQPVSGLFAKLAVLNGILQQFDLHLRRSEDLVRKDLREGRAGSLGAGAALVIRDLSEWPSDGWARHYSAGAYVRQGRQFIPVIRNLRRLSSGWVVSQGFEAFESALKGQVSRYLRRHPEEFGMGAWKAAKEGRFVLGQKTPIAKVEVLVRNAFRGTHDLLPRLRKTLPSLRQAEAKNNRAMNLVVWFKAASNARHAYVHSGGLISAAVIASLTPHAQSVLTASFPGRHTQAGYRIEMTPIAAREVLSRYAEYCNLVSKALSEVDHLPWTMPKGRRL